jgi:hypothetical protein
MSTIVVLPYSSTFVAVSLLWDMDSVKSYAGKVELAVQIARFLPNVRLMTVHTTMALTECAYLCAGGMHRTSSSPEGDIRP